MTNETHQEQAGNAPGERHGVSQVGLRETIEAAGVNDYRSIFDTGEKHTPARRPSAHNAAPVMSTVTATR